MPVRGGEPAEATVESRRNVIGALSAANALAQSVRAVEGAAGERASGYATDEEM